MKKRAKKSPPRKKTDALKRPRQPMPGFVRTALKTDALSEAYRARPAYQRNDYLWWIHSAKREPTKQKRLRQMLAELSAGDRYMNMAWRTR